MSRFDRGSLLPGSTLYRLIDSKAKREAIKIFSSLISSLPVSVTCRLKDLFKRYKPGENVTNFIQRYNKTKEGN
jgi:hypothetical protein